MLQNQRLKRLVCANQRIVNIASMAKALKLALPRFKMLAIQFFHGCVDGKITSGPRFDVIELKVTAQTRFNFIGRQQVEDSNFMAPILESAEAGLNVVGG